MADTHPYRPSVADRIGIVIFMVAGVAIILWSAWLGVSRVVHLLSGEGFQATARLADLQVEAPIGPGGSSVPLAIDAATVTSSHLSTAGFGAAIIAQVVLFVTIATIVVCLMLLALGTLRGRIFSRRNTGLVTASGLTALVGFSLAPVFDGMVANDIMSQLTGPDFDGYAVLAAEPLPFVLGAFAFGIVTTAYTVGARMQRDTEGLV